MHNPGRWPAIATVLAAGMLTSAVTASGAVSGHSGPATATPRAGETLTVIAKRGAFSLAGAPAVGTGFIAGGGLFDANGTNKIGDGYSHCGVVSVDPQAVTFVAQCTTVFTLPDGQLDMSSLRSYSADGFKESKFAITGGTDKYRTARGDGTGTLTDPGTHTYKFVLNITE